MFMRHYFQNFAAVHQFITAIMEGKEKTGITIMYMVEKLDAGDILTQVEVEIEERETTGSLFDKLSEAGAHLLSKTVRFTNSR